MNGTFVASHSKIPNSRPLAARIAAVFGRLIAVVLTVGRFAVVEIDMRIVVG